MDQTLFALQRLALQRLALQRLALKRRADVFSASRIPAAACSPSGRFGWIFLSPISPLPLSWALLGRFNVGIIPPERPVVGIAGHIRSVLSVTADV